MTCRICNNYNSNKIWVGREMMLGLREEFEYLECSDCGCLQILSVPKDISKYYPSDYYSLNFSPERYFKGWLKKKVKSYRDYSIITGRLSIGSLLQKVVPNQSIELSNFRYAGLKRSFKILDVGSGTGIIPYVFRNAGFVNITGIDPYLECDIEYNNGLVIAKKSLFEISDEARWDVVMFNHSFEHLADPLEHLNKVRSILTPKGICIIRIPTVSSFAWREYRTNWVQLDAPRHVFLYSKQSLKHLAHNGGFAVEKISYESTPFQFIGSEQYRKNISMHGDEESFFRGNKKLFTRRQLASFKNKTRYLNQSGDADSIAVILRKSKHINKHN